MVAIAALETLAGIDREASFPLTVQALQHPDEEVVNAALNLLAAAGRTDWIEPVRGQMLDHPYWEVRSSFVRTMAELEGSACLRHLEDRLLVEGEELVRQQIRDLVAGLRQEQG
jgi:HEAT repeat protein